MSKSKAVGLGVSTFAVLALLSASSVSANETSDTHTNLHTQRVGKALGQKKWVVTQGEILSIDTSNRIVTARVKNSNRKVLRGTIVQFTVANDATIRLGTGFIKWVEDGFTVHPGRRATLDKLMPGDTLLFATGTGVQTDSAWTLTANKIWAKRTLFQINMSVTAVDTAASPDTMTGTVGNASKNTDLDSGDTTTVRATAIVKVKRDGVTSTWGAVMPGDLAVAKGYITLSGGEKVFNVTDLKAKSPEFLTNLNANANTNS